MTQAQVARALERHQSFVSKYEKGDRRLDVVELADVCAVLGVSLRSVLARVEVTAD